jgi:TPR repeat protein
MHIDLADAYKYYRLAALGDDDTEVSQELLEQVESKMTASQLCQALIGTVEACDVEHPYDGQKLLELAEKYEHGVDVQSDLGEAFRNYVLAAAKGCKAAWPAITRLRSQLSKDEAEHAWWSVVHRLTPRM